MFWQSNTWNTKDLRKATSPRFASRSSCRCLEKEWNSRYKPLEKTKEADLPIFASLSPKRRRLSCSEKRCLSKNEGWPQTVTWACHDNNLSLLYQQFLEAECSLKCPRRHHAQTWKQEKCKRTTSRSKPSPVNLIEVSCLSESFQFWSLRQVWSPCPAMHH